LSHVSTTLIFYTENEIGNQNSTKEVEMSSNRFVTLLTIMALVVVVAFTVQASFATSSAVSNVDSATRSYMGWARAVDAGQVKDAIIPITGTGVAIDSAAQSYIGWAKMVECGANPAYELTVDSATRSYIEWARSVQCENAS